MTLFARWGFEKDLERNVGGLREAWCVLKPDGTL